jgi:hypothetical protein
MCALGKGSILGKVLSAAEKAKFKLTARVSADSTCSSRLNEFFSEKGSKWCISRTVTKI